MDTEIPTGQPRIDADIQQKFGITQSDIDEHSREKQQRLERLQSITRQGQQDYELLTKEMPGRRKAVIPLGASNIPVHFKELHSLPDAAEVELEKAQKQFPDIVEPKIAAENLTAYLLGWKQGAIKLRDWQTLISTADTLSENGIENDAETTQQLITLAGDNKSLLVEIATAVQDRVNRRKNIQDAASS